MSAAAHQSGVALNGGMHASIFVKVWGDAGGGDDGRTALAQYAFDLGAKSVAAVPEYQSVIGEAAQVLESAAAHNREQGRTVLAHTQQDRADRLREVLGAMKAAIGVQP